jgi:hypothetical protein
MVNILFRAIHEIAPTLWPKTQEQLLLVTFDQAPAVGSVKLSPELAHFRILVKVLPRTAFPWMS